MEPKVRGSEWMVNYRRMAAIRCCERVRRNGSAQDALSAPGFVQPQTESQSMKISSPKNVIKMNPR
jgi:hypothetical protein